MDPVIEEVHLELNQLMEDLEATLPKFPVPGPDEPQVPAESPKGKEVAVDSLPATSQPIATPCRSHVGCPSVGNLESKNESVMVSSKVSKAAED